MPGFIKYIKSETKILNNRIKIRIRRRRAKPIIIITYEISWARSV